MTTEEQAAFLRLIDKLRVFVEKEIKKVPAPIVFKPDQLVRRVARSDGGPPVGCIGVVRCLSSLTRSNIGVEWAELSGWHDGLPHGLNGTLKSRCGWYVPSGDLELCNPDEA